MKTKNNGKKTMLLCSLFFLLAGCMKDNRTMEGGCSEELRRLWIGQGDISNKNYNSIRDLRAYYLTHRDTLSFHRYDNVPVKVWGYRWCDCYPVEPYYDSIEGDSVLMIVLATKLLHYDKYSSSNDPSYYFLTDSACVIMAGNEILHQCGEPLPDTMHAFLKGNDIATAMSNPEKRLLMYGTLDVRQSTIDLFPNCFAVPDCSIGLDVLNLQISSKP